MARFLGGATSGLFCVVHCFFIEMRHHRHFSNASTSPWEHTVEDMARIGQPEAIPAAAAQGPVRSTIWTAIHPRLLNCIRAHHFDADLREQPPYRRAVGKRDRTARRRDVVRSRQSLGRRAQRIEVEDRLKAGLIRGLVATSSLKQLRIDIGAIDLVIQIKAHAVGRERHAAHRRRCPGARSARPAAASSYRNSAATRFLVRRRHAGHARSRAKGPTVSTPDPLDVLAQQLVAMVSSEQWKVDDLFDAVRRVSVCRAGAGRVRGRPRHAVRTLPVSDDFANLRPRLTWDRIDNVLTARDGAKTSTP